MDAKDLSIVAFGSNDWGHFPVIYRISSPLQAFDIFVWDGYQVGVEFGQEAVSDVVQKPLGSEIRKKCYHFTLMVKRLTTSKLFGFE